MVNWRFSLAGLLCATGFIAVACAALAHPSPLWATIAASSTVAVLFYAVLAAIHRIGEQLSFGALKPATDRQVGPAGL